MVRGIICASGDVFFIEGWESILRTKVKVGILLIVVVNRIGCLVKFDRVEAVGD
jgi:hypothetical protein